jgi:PPP family 3-phenylpropionic acid transporter
VSRATPIAVYYFAVLGALGVFWPFFALHLRALGLPAGEITILYALIPAMGLVAPPLAGLLADLLNARIWLLRALTAASVVAFAGVVWAGASRPALYAATVAFALCRAPLGPIADASAVEHVRRHGGSFGRVRLWGSVGYLVAAVGGGALLDAVGLVGVLGATMLALSVAAVAAWAVPAAPARHQPEAAGATRRLLGQRALWLFLGAVALGQVAGATYDSCFTLHLQRLGFGGSFTGVAYATGVLAEVALLVASGRLLVRFGPRPIFAFALATAVVRWLLLARVRTAAAILLLQPLHGVTFGLFYVSAVVIVRERADRVSQTAAQGVFGGAYALGGVVGMPLAGAIFERAGATVLYGTAAVVATLAFGCALWFARRAAPGQS